MKSHLPILLFFAVIVFSACQTGQLKKDPVTGYAFQNPDASVVLPGILQEISGLSCVDSNTVICIQDEKGILFLYNLSEKKIIKQIKFYSDGDYEGIAKVQDTIYVLRSDGTIFEISDYISDNFEVTLYSTDIPSKDNEGLCYDQENNRLLIACKEITGKGELTKDERYVFAFDLYAKKLVDEPSFSFNIKLLKKFASNKNISLPLIREPKGSGYVPDIKFQISGIAIHPITKSMYLLSAVDYLLFVFEKDGNISTIIRLNAGLYNQPEGITFMENGDLLISNEGRGRGPGTLRRINRHFENISH
jgi:uncharacterized protein YjiK